MGNNDKMQKYQCQLESTSYRPISARFIYSTLSKCAFFYVIRKESVYFYKISGIYLSVSISLFVYYCLYLSFCSLCRYVTERGDQNNAGTTFLQPPISAEYITAILYRVKHMRKQDFLSSIYSQVGTELRNIDTRSSIVQCSVRTTWTQIVN